MRPGPLARLQFRVVAQGSPTIDILERMPMFAPASANVGIMLPEPLKIAANGR